MPLVSALRSERRDRVQVELDGAPWRTLPVAAVVAAGLRPGVELDRRRARELGRALRRHAAMQRASAALAVRDRSRAGLDTVIERRGVAPAERQAAIETMSRLGYLDDQRYASGRAAALAGRGYGDEAIRFELGRDEVGGELVEAALAALEPELERARRRLRPGQPAREARALAARGFSAETIEALLGLAD